MSSLRDTVVVVTGASGRLGRRLMRRFADEGAVLAAVVRSEAGARDMSFRKDGEGAVFVADVTNEEQVRVCFDRIRHRFGRVRALVHTAGMWEARALADTSLDAWRFVIEINLTSAFLCFREAIRVMEPGGRLVAFASRQGADRGVAGQAAYSAAKAGVIRLAEAVNAESHGMTAHVVAPSMILFDEEGKGVPAGDLVEIVRNLLVDPGDVSGDALIRAYGSG